jgi:putative endonuclease
MTMTDTQKQQVGKRGEDLAAEYLQQQGFSIVDRNYWKPWGEIDLIARREGELRFVEVKTVVRRMIREDDYEPEDNIHPWKLKRLRRVIETYLLANDWVDEEDLDWQFDALAVYLDPAGDLLKIEHLEDLGI